MTHFPGAVLRDPDGDDFKRFAETTDKTPDLDVHKDIEMSKQAEFAVILQMNAMIAALCTDELQRLSNLCHTQLLSIGVKLFLMGVPKDTRFGVRRGQVRIETGASD